jgi:hypothetical protein
MAIITPVAYNTGSTINGTTQIGSLSVGTTGQDYSIVGSQNNVTYYATPDQETGYVIAYPDASGGHNGKPGNVPARVGFLRTTSLTNQSFINLAQYVSILFNNPQTFATASAAVTWLNTNGYWTSYVAVPEYTIGESALGGTIAYINGGGQTGTSGLVISSGQSLGQTNWDSANSGALSFESGGFTDWRLPTIEELELFYPNKTTLNFIEFLGFYWCSTIGDGLNFFNGARFSSNPANPWQYRAVREF